MIVSNKCASVTVAYDQWQPKVTCAHWVGGMCGSTLAQALGLHGQRSHGVWRSEGWQGCQIGDEIVKHFYPQEGMCPEPEVL